MDRLLEHIDALPLPILAAALLAGGAVHLFLPHHRRLEILLVLTPAWMFLYLSSELEPLDSVVRATGPFVLAVLAVTCARSRGPKRHLPAVALIYPLAGVLGLFGVMTATDAVIASGLRIYWLMVIAAAWQIARVCSSPERLAWVVERLAWSGVIILIACAIPLLADPDGALRYGRFEPWGIGANTTGSTMLFVAPLFACQAIAAQRRRKTVLWALAFGGALGLTVLTASRTAAIATLIALLPLTLSYARRVLSSRATIIKGAAGLAALLLVLAASRGVVNLSPEVRTERYTSIETARYRIIDRYLRIIDERPFTGLMLTDGEWAVADEDVGRHAHNVFLIWAYLAGLPLAGLIAVLAVISSFRVWSLRSSAVALAVMGIVVGGWVSGLATLQVQHPGAPLSLIHATFVLIAVGATSRARRSVRVRHPSVVPASRSMIGYPQAPRYS